MRNANGVLFPVSIGKGKQSKVEWGEDVPHQNYTATAKSME